MSKESIKPLAISGTIIVLLLSVSGWLYVSKENMKESNNTELVKAVKELTISVTKNTEHLKGKTTKDTEQDSKILNLENKTSKHDTDIEILKNRDNDN